MRAVRIPSSKKNFLDSEEEEKKPSMPGIMHDVQWCPDLVGFVRFHLIEGLKFYWLELKRGEKHVSFF